MTEGTKERVWITWRSDTMGYSTFFHSIRETQERTKRGGPKSTDKIYIKT